MKEITKYLAIPTEASHPGERRASVRQEWVSSASSIDGRRCGYGQTNLSNGSSDDLSVAVGLTLQLRSDWRFRNICMWIDA